MRAVDLLIPFFTSMGIVLGGSIVGSLSVLGTASPLHQMHVLARSIKIWAVVIAMGGTFPAVRAIESGIWSGEAGILLRQLAILIASFLGAQAAYWMVQSLTGAD